MDEGRRGDREHGTIARLVRTAAERHGDRPAVVVGEEVLSFARLAGEVKRASRALLAAGVAPGDRVALWAPNGWRWIVAALAVHSTGASLVPVNTRFKGEEAAYVLAKSRARVLFATTDFLGADALAMLARSGAPLPSLETVVVLAGVAPAGALSWARFLDRADAIPESVADARAFAVQPDDVCDILFTSGTTGRPRGAMSTHAQTLRAFRDWGDIVGLRAEDRYLVALPFFHSFGYKAGWLACILMGATTYPLAVFDVSAVLDRVERHAITVLPGPPSLYQSILARDDLPRRKLGSLRLAVTGAAVVPVELVGRMRREMGFDTVLTGYGLTEANGVSTLCRGGDDPETIAGTSGRAIPGVEVRVVDDEGRDVPAGTPGEVVVSGYTLMKGYFDDEGATADSFDGEGRLRTGDVGVMDARGYLRITDRKKDMFIVGGFNAYPAEIEASLLGHDAIAQVAVVGAPDERLGEVGVA
ncbi:MAG TPA: AMP-binding protein, partial [Polyangiaceae bacterium]|nr:AMP-binding protein [Polyangiaceae bacterium]